MEPIRIRNIIVKKIEKNMNLKYFPHITTNGKWTSIKDGYWTGGFHIGLLWFSHLITGDKKYKEAAYTWAKRLEHRKKDRTFDLGFLFYPSDILGYEISGYNYFKKVALEAAYTLTKCFNEKSGFIYEENKLNNKRIGRTIIDVMMNLPLLWWAYRETGNTKYYDLAYSHSRRTIDEFIRKDYSTIHAIDFDLKTGKIIRKITVQGYNNESCWSRGQAWAIYGFTLAYKTSKDELFLKTAEKLARYFIKFLPNDYVPYWDFNDPEKSVKDSSAAAIASSGLITLSKLVGQKKFKKIAVKILDSLCNHYLVEEDKDGIITHGCFHKPEGIGVDESLIWGDYYFVEALMKVGDIYSEKG